MMAGQFCSGFCDPFYFNQASDRRDDRLQIRGSCQDSRAIPFVALGGLFDRYMFTFMSVLYKDTRIQRRFESLVSANSKLALFHCIAWLLL